MRLAHALGFGHRLAAAFALGSTLATVPVATTATTALAVALVCGGLALFASLTFGLRGVMAGGPSLARARLVRQLRGLTVSALSGVQTFRRALWPGARLVAVTASTAAPTPAAALTVRLALGAPVLIAPFCTRQSLGCCGGLGG